MNDYVTFLQFRTPRFLLGAGASGRPDEGSLGTQTSSGTSFFFLSQAKFRLLPLLLPENWAFAKVITGVARCPPPGLPQLSGTVGRGPPHPIEHTLPLPQQCTRSETDPRPSPSPPHLGQEVMHLLLLTIYLFGETEMM